MLLQMENNSLSPEYWGEINGEEVYLYELANASGTVVGVTNFGATLTKIVVPDYAGRFADVILGYDDLQGYANDEHFIGSIVGRYANRISGGGLVDIDGDKYQLTVTDRGFHHHGGKVGFNKKVWKTLEYGGQSISMSYLSADMEEGFPGNLTIIIKYSLTDNNELEVCMQASTDKATILNVTNHAYFNLSGHNSGSTLKHQLLMPLDHYLPVDRNQLVTGEIRSVTNTAFDFRKPKSIYHEMLRPDPQLAISRGFDHTWIIKHRNAKNIKLAAILTDKQSRRGLRVYTTEPSVHLYSGNFLNDVTGKDGAVYKQHDGICLETQHFPDSPNHPRFPSTLLRPGKVFKTKTIFQFSVEKE